MSQQTNVWSTENFVFKKVNQLFNNYKFSTNKACPDQDVDYGSGLSYSGVTTDDWQNCGTQCKEDENCKYWAWTENDKKCRKRSGKTPVDARVGAISGTKSCESGTRNIE